ncbi:M56 family metallopeptidase [Hymenobacter terricola]|uniref:M56 family metallopeptidase n=1 Tax=Hymenobacter terricola TaxID=2819236 RepID=UPI001B3061A9|nr:M56 family metallopeptidase [Hymenobacter terricola]
MSTLENFVSPALTRALGWTLLHSLWQGALVAAVLAGALLLLRRQRAEVRYVASAGALGMVVALAGITFGLYFNAGAGNGGMLRPGTLQGTRVLPLKPAGKPVANVSAAAGPIGQVTTEANVKSGPVAVVAGRRLEAHSTPQPLSQALQTGLRYFDNHLPLLVVAWLLGLLAMSLRMLGGLLYVQRLRRYRVRPLPAVWQERLAALAARSGIRRPVALLESALVQVPLVVGHLRPVILLPLGTVAGLSPAYLEAVLAHELAHVLRRDYLVNLLQTVAEVLFFYHPAVWFMANCVRAERENCCDDTATALVGGDPLRLARALTALAEWSQSAVVPTAPRLALAAIGGRGALLNRVRRLVQRRPAAPTLAEGIMAGALVLGGLGLLGSSVALAGPLAQPTTPEKKPTAFDWQTGPAQTTPTPKSASSADTTKRVTGTSSTTTTTTTAPAPPAPDQSGNVRSETTVTQHGPGADAPQPPADDQPGQDPPGRNRRNRRASQNGFEYGPRPFPGQPGTVVITKDKKGRLTDLVVNGQRVDTETGQGKLKIKDKGQDGKGQQVQIIQVMPQDFPEARAFVFRKDAGDQRQFERKVERDMERSFNYQFQFPQPQKQLAEKRYAEKLYAEQFNKSFNGGFNGNFNRNFRMQNPGNGPSLDAQRDALHAAERALREAGAVKSLGAEQRKRISRELEKVQAARKQLESASSMKRLRLNGADNRTMDEQFSKLNEEMRDREAELRDRQQEQQDLEQSQADRDREQDDRDRERADHKREQSDREQERADRRRDQEDDALVDQLAKDGLIKNKENFQLRLTGSSLTINGKEQSQPVFQKYLKLYASTHPGRKMGPKGAMVITRNSDTNTSTSNSSDLPRPPRPPRVPRAPLPPLAPMAPMAPPAPPKPPRVDTETLRNELRKDGLIGSDDKSFQLQLNNSGLTVNGKKQSDKLAEKYRKLTGNENGNKYNVTISSDE